MISVAIICFVAIGVIIGSVVGHLYRLDDYLDMEAERDLARASELSARANMRLAQFARQNANYQSARLGQRIHNQREVIKGLKSKLRAYKAVEIPVGVVARANKEVAKVIQPVVSSFNQPNQPTAH